jgi:hypothetical protein
MSTNNLNIKDTELDTIMQRRIELFNNYIMGRDIEKIPLGLFHGKTGISIYFYNQACIFGNKKYERFADKLLDTVYSQIHNGLPFDLENGIVGICWGLLYLIDNGFVKGNPNYVLKDLDDKIFSTLYFSLLTDRKNTSLDEVNTIVHCALYFCKRLLNKRLSANERNLFKQIIIWSINKIELSSEVGKMIEPFPFSPYNYFPFIYLLLINRVYELDFYTYKIEKVCDEWSDRLLSSYPLLQSYRLLLAQAMEGIHKYRNFSNWKKHISLLKQQTDMEHIISTEFRNRNVFINDGLSGFYFLEKGNNTLNDILKEEIKKKLSTSEIWIDFENGCENVKKTYSGLISGIPGLISTYLDIKTTQQ